MNKDEFIALYGPSWKEFESSNMGVALFRLIDDQHPVRLINNQSEGNRLAGAAVFLNEIAGYEKLQALIKSIGAEPPKPESPDEDSFQPEPE